VRRAGCGSSAAQPSHPYGRDATTRDIDALFSRSTDVAEVIAEIAQERAWPEN